MKKLFLILFACIICLPVFAKHAKKKKRQSSNTSAIQSIMIDRTGCFGKCPTYSIKIDNSGIVTYTGKRFVTDSGVYTKNVGATITTEIIHQLHFHKVDTCRNLYENMIPDLPGLVYTIQYKDSTKKIRNAFWGPEYLKQIAVAIDDLGKVHDNTWKKEK